MTRLPAPEQWVIETLNEIQLGELLEEYIDFVDEDGKSVHLQDHFVRHYLNQSDSPLPTLAAIATAPVVLADGVLLAPEGLDRPRGIDFIIQPELRAVVPTRAQANEKAVGKAMQFLTDEWLVDVATDYEGKCILIAAGLTLIERSLLPTRPVFFVTAGKRGNGKTTTLQMLLMGVTGLPAAAAAWSTSEEERRKALLSYFLMGVPYILWDNIPKGTQISCPHIERSCTIEWYADRRLGVSELVRTAATTIHLFTGNNVGAKGDLASRALTVRLNVDRPDPANRKFTHPDPIGWTDGHRAEIMGALYTILLGNRFLDEPRDAPCDTRFKMWWRLVGSAIEHAAEIVGEHVSFKNLFLEQESEEEDTVALAEMLTKLRDTFPPTRNEDGVLKPTSFTASNLAVRINDGELVSVRDFLFEGTFIGEEGGKVSALSVGKRLAMSVDNPTLVEDYVLTLKSGTGENHTKNYWVRRMRAED